MQIWNCSTDESNHRVHDFFKSQHFAAGILPIPGKLGSFTLLHPIDCPWQALTPASIHSESHAACLRQSTICPA